MRAEPSHFKNLLRNAFSAAAVSIALMLCAMLASGCAVGSAPIKATPKIVATPHQGELSIATLPSHPIGEVEPVYVSIANGTNVPRQVVPDQIFALDADGNRVAPIPPDEAARQAGGAGALKSALESAATTGAIEGGVGAGIGALAGSFLHSGATGAILGGAIGGAEGLVSGASSGPSKTADQAAAQVPALALQPSDVRQNFTVSGYVFFPKGDYKEIDLLLVNSETGDTEVIERPWK